MNVVSAQLGLAGIRAAKYVCSLQSRFFKVFLEQVLQPKATADANQHMHS